MNKNIIYRKLKNFARKDQNVKTVILFGSFVKKRKYNDIDVLIVRDKTPTKPILYGKEVVRLRNKLDFTEMVDLIVVNPKTFKFNLENHEPFYLDIAFDGKVIYGQKFTESIFKKIRNYVEEKGIKRDNIFGGWTFPIKYREATYLSKVTTKDKALIWLNEAMIDYESAKLTLKKLPSRCINHCEQAIEKSVKAVLICFGEFKRTHYVGDVLKQVALEKEVITDWQKKLKELAGYSQEIEPEFAKTRYPDVLGDDIWIPSKRYTKKEAVYYFRLATKSLKITQEFINWWFK